MSKKALKRLCAVLSAVLMLSMLFSFSGTAVESDLKFTRISACVSGDTENSIGISWSSSVSAASDVKICKANSDNYQYFTGSQSLFKDYYMHKAQITGLDLGTTYFYSVGDKTKDIWSEPRSFKTDDADNELSFVVIADVQASNEDSFRKGSEVLSAALDAAPNADFVANLGDFVNDCTNEEWDWYFDQFSSPLSNVSFAPIAGNHDGNLKWNWFNNMFALTPAEGSKTTTGVYYSFDYGNAHFAVLNTNDMYPMSQEQINWLTNDMNMTDKDWKFVLMHRSLYSAGKNINKPDTYLMRSRLLPVIDELDIDIVFAGHDHMYLRSESVKNDEKAECTYVTELFNGKEYRFAVEPSGTTHILPNTAGTKRYSVNSKAMSPILDLAAKAEQPGKPCYAIIRIVDGKLVYDCYSFDVEGTKTSEIIDSYAIKKTPAGAATPDYQPLNTSGGANLFRNIASFIFCFSSLFVTYLPKIFTYF